MKRLRHRPRPYRQGDLDGLCGIYAIVNAVRIALHPDSRLKNEAYAEFFDDLIKELGRSRGLGRSIEGVSTPEVGRLLQSAKTIVETNFGTRLETARPLLGGKRWSITRAARRLRTELNHPGTSVILGLAGQHDHWTVAYRITDTTILLSDSGRIKRLSIKRCTMKYRSRIKTGSRHIVGPGSVFLVRKLPQG